MKEENSELDRLGRSIKIQLDNYFTQWNSGLPYKKMFTKYSTSAKKLGMGLSEFSEELEKRGYVKLFCTPSGKRYVFSASIDWNNEEILTHVMALENEKQA